MWNSWFSKSSTESVLDRLLNKVVNVDYPERFHSFLVMGCPTDSDSRKNSTPTLLNSVWHALLVAQKSRYVCVLVWILHCTMARLDDECQDLEKVIIWYSISDSAMMCLKPAYFANGGWLYGVVNSRGTLSITGHQANMGQCRYLLPPTTYLNTKLLGILLVPGDGGLMT